MNKILVMGYLAILYVLSYFLLYTYSLFGFDIIYPWNMLLYLLSLLGFIYVVKLEQKKLSVNFTYVMLLLFSLLVSFQLTGMYLDPMTRGYVIGASTSRMDFDYYLQFGPWFIWKNYELSLLYVRIPSLVAILIAIFPLIRKKRTELINYFYFIFAYILVLIPYLLIIESFMEIGV